MPEVDLEASFGILLTHYFEPAFSKLDRTGLELRKFFPVNALLFWTKRVPLRRGLRSGMQLLSVSGSILRFLNQLGEQNNAITLTPRDSESAESLSYAGL